MNTTTPSANRFRFRAWFPSIKEMNYCEPLESVWDDTSAATPCPPVWMQSTGLTDKHGKEIYEGDIVSLDGNMTADNSLGFLPNGWHFDEHSKYAVVWDQELAGWTLDFSKTTFGDVEKEWGSHKDAYIAKYKNHARSLLIDKQVLVIGDIYSTPDLLPKA